MRAKPDFEAIFDASPNPYMVLDHDLRYVAANRAYLSVTNRRREELLGQRVTDVFPHDPNDPNNESARRLLASFERVFSTRQPDVLPLIHYRILVPSSQGARYEDHYWSATHTPLLDEAGQVEFILQHTVNVTDQHRRRQVPQGALAGDPAPAQVEADILGRAELVQQLNEADRMTDRLRSVYAQAPVAITMLRGPAYVIELANSRVCELWGRTEAQVLGRPLFEALPETVGQGLEELLADVRSSGKPYVGTDLPVRVARGEGGKLEEVWFNFVYQPLKERDGHVDSVMVVASDVTEQVLARRKAEAAQAELEAIFESFPEALFVGDATGVKRANAAARDILGYGSVEDVLRPQRQLVAELLPRRADTGAPIPANDTPFARALRGLETRLEVTIKHWRTKEERFVLSSAAPIRIGGAITGAVVTQINITEQKRAETEALQLAKVLNVTRDFVGIANLAGQPTFVNEAALQLMGLPDMKAARQLPLLEYFVERQRSRVRDEVLPTALRDGYWEGELLFLHQRTAEELPVLYAVFPLRDGAGNITALATITRDLRARKAADAERAQLLQNEQEARAQAEQANRLKDQFLAIVSHELRTPLTSMLGWLQMLKSGMLSAEKQARALDTVERNARVQAQLIDDLLDVSRIVSGKLVMEMEPADIGAVVGAAVETVRPVAEAKGVRLEVTLESSSMVRGDNRRLQQVVWNLLSNAVKFTPREGQVLVQVERRGNAVEVLVRDTGVGIPVEFLPYVFERFRQAEAGPARKLGGLGLGLSIVRHVVEAHGGEVQAFSAGEGKGATFTVRLPILVSSGKPLLAPARGDAGFEAPAALEGLHVLLVDDEEDTREYVRALLQQCKAKVTVATSAAEALAALQRERPDVLLSDIGMPEEDGYMLIQRVRALPDAQGGRTPAVALTAYARTEDRARAMLAGFQNHVTKPIEPVELLAVLASLAARPERRS